MGVDVAGKFELVGYPSQFPSVSMVDWNDGKPNPRLRVLQLLHDRFGPGDKVVEITPPSPPMHSNPHIYSMAVVTKSGKPRVLLASRRYRQSALTIARASSADLEYVDHATGFP